VKLGQGYVGHHGAKQGQDKVKLVRHSNGIVRFRMKPHGQGRAKRSKGIDVLSSVMAEPGRASRHAATALLSST
jgi:hypothetical protein